MSSRGTARTNTPPSSGSPVQCGHEWQHLDTQYLCFSRSFGVPRYKMVDRFYCTKCCEIKEFAKEETTHYQPEWFDSKQARTVHD